ncbi:MAG TPA: response regulator [candidate division Zixibacteria bacterium]|nr:response regulator [candidate division Zixibacteria bacterium]MDD4917001.1 response regulator [candidate division Zixibacteria bacterium]MDM7972608.1 response regulator [candidate division Zixibacteria bacterium]HOD66166.1 response regulator [candidate division Zixibacteria bacterium]HOZ08114.1 response regulator [candidate division Zixibacteria bacterium]
MDESVRRSVLVVDDEEIIRSFLFEVLSEEYDVSLACDGDEAIEQIRKRRYDVIITDLKMPRVSGEEVVKFACDRDPQSKVIVISGFSSLYTVSQSINNGACAFLSKPFSIKELMRTVTNALCA